MTLYLAEFPNVEKLTHAARALRHDGHTLHDCFTPFPVEEMDQMLGLLHPNIRRTMLIAGMAVAALAYGIQWYSAVVSFPLDVGGRPLHSWPVFLLVPFEVGVLAAAVAGLISFLRGCGLPRLHHRIFDNFDFERASQDRFFLLAAAQEAAPNLRSSLQRAGALNISEVSD
jgi:Protein of unknown function (DUF3341)